MPIDAPAAISPPPLSPFASGEVLVVHTCAKAQVRLLVVPLLTAVAPQLPPFASIERGLWIPFLSHAFRQLQKPEGTKELINVGINNSVGTFRNLSSPM